MNPLYISHESTLKQPQSNKLFTATLIIAAHVAIISAVCLIKNTITNNAEPKEVFLSVITPSLSKPEPIIISTAKALPTPAQVFIPAPETITQQVASPILAVTNTPPTEVTIKPVAPQAAPAPAITKEHTGPKVVSAVEYVNAPKANYPTIAKRMGEEGRVVMQVLVNEKGRAEKVEVIQSSGFNRLDEEAKLALMRALFKPYLENGKASTMLATASISFSLRG